MYMSSASSTSNYSSLGSTSTPPPPPATTTPGDVHGSDWGAGGGGVGDTVFLMAVASLGVTLNALVAASLLTMPPPPSSSKANSRHSAVTSSFVMHASLLDAVKCVYCVPFAVTSLHPVDTAVCDALSRSCHLQPMTITYPTSYNLTIVLLSRMLGLL